MLMPPTARSDRRSVLGSLPVGSWVKEPRTGKSFRAAGDRIVRQESAAPSVVTRLLGAPAQAVREIRSDDDAWAVRLAALAVLGQYDGLACVVGEPLDMS